MPANLPEARSRGAATVRASLIYIAAGWTTGPTVTSDLYRYDPTLDTYTALAAASVARGQTGLTNAASGLFLLGGRTTTGATRTTTTANEVFQLVTSGWMSAPDLPAARTRHGAAPGDGGTIYLGFGWTSGPAVSDGWMRFDPGLGTYTAKAMGLVAAAMRGLTRHPGEMSIHALGGRTATGTTRTTTASHEEYGVESAAPTPTTLEASPASQTKRKGQIAEVTLTVKDQSGVVMAGERIRWSVAGAATAQGQGLSDAAGQIVASFEMEAEGTATLHAFADANDDGIEN